MALDTLGAEMITAAADTRTLKRVVGNADVAAANMPMFSDYAGFVSGQHLLHDGGASSLCSAISGNQRAVLGQVR
jgi:enoyl-[acyl-carrier-protein] reductase (NADH)